MNRGLLYMAVVLGASLPLLLDSAVKGGVILLLAGVLALMLRRDSAATRHLVWLAAIVVMLVVPVFSVLLPHGTNASSATGRMGAVPAPVLPPADEVRMGELLVGEAQHHRGSLRIPIEAWTHEVLVGHEDLELQIEEAASLARKPTAPS